MESLWNLQDDQCVRLTIVLVSAHVCTSQLCDMSPGLQGHSAYIAIYSSFTISKAGLRPGSIGYTHNPPLRRSVEMYVHVYSSELHEVGPVVGFECEAGSQVALELS